VANADGSGFKKLTSNAGMNCLPTYSSDGSKIAFWSTRTGEWELYVMDAQGHGARALTKSSGLGNLPTGITRAVWSPEGNYIAYSSTDSSGNKSLIVMDLDGHQAKIADNVGDLTEWRSAEFQSGATDIVNIKATP
jgi:TolB protein